MEDPSKKPIEKKQTFGVTQCGADRGIFKWCQTISDVDVEVSITPSIKASTDIKVEISQCTLLVQLKASKNLWYTVIEDRLCDKVKANEMIWTFEPGKLSIHLEKVQERWWDCLLEKEPKINLEEFELSRPLSDLNQEEEMTLQKLWNDQLKKICQI